MSTDLQILGAAYGLVKVTPRIISLVSRSTNPQSLSVQASNSIFGDRWPDVQKTLVVVYRYGENGSVNVAIAKEGTTLTISGGYNVLRSALNQKLTVLAAVYGLQDVTSTVTSLVSQRNQTLSFTPNNSTFGDTWPDVQKSFVIVAEYVDQTPFIDIVPENTPYLLKYRPPLQIFNAYFGPQSVLPVVENAISRRAVSIQATDQIFGDTWPGVQKTLSVVYQYGNQIPQLAAVVQNSSLEIDYNPDIGEYNIPTNPLTLNVVSAVFGPKDVTNTVNNLKGNTNQLGFTVNNDTFIFGGDPLPGQQKSFSMTYSWGPSSPKSLVAKEEDPISITSPNPKNDFIPLNELVVTGDQVTFQGFNNQFWQVVNTQILVTAESLDKAEKFKIIDGPDPGSFYLQALSDQSYVTIGADGTLHTGGPVATLLVISLQRSGSAAISVAGNQATPFMSINSAGAIAALGSYIVDTASTFFISCMYTSEGTSNRLRTHGIKSIAEDDGSLFALTKVIWDLTGGWFLALGLGPLISQGELKPGLIYILKSNLTVWHTIVSLGQTLLNNPEASIRTFFLTIGKQLYEENLLWTVFSMVVDTGKWLSISFALVKVLEFTILPEVAFAEITVSVAIWAHTTTVDVLAWANSGSEHIHYFLNL